MSIIEKFSADDDLREFARKLDIKYRPGVDKTFEDAEVEAYVELVEAELALGSVGILGSFHFEPTDEGIVPAVGSLETEDLELYIATFENEGEEPDDTFEPDIDKEAATNAGLHIGATIISDTHHSSFINGVTRPGYDVEPSRVSALFDARSLLQ